MYSETQGTILVHEDFTQFEIYKTKASNLQYPPNKHLTESLHVRKCDKTSIKDLPFSTTWLERSL